MMPRMTITTATTPATIDARIPPNKKSLPVIPLWKDNVDQVAQVTRIRQPVHNPIMTGTHMNCLPYSTRKVLPRLAITGGIALLSNLRSACGTLPNVLWHLPANLENTTLGIGQFIEVCEGANSRPFTRRRPANRPTHRCRQSSPPRQDAYPTTLMVRLTEPPWCAGAAFLARMFKIAAATMLP